MSYMDTFIQYFNSISNSETLATHEIPVDAIVSIGKLQNVGVEGGLRHRISQVKDIYMHPSIMHEELPVSSIWFIANVDEVTP